MTTTTKPDVGEGLWDVDDVAAFLKASKAWVYQKSAAGKPRKEITPEHAATVMRVLSVFPGSHVVAFEKTTNPERQERPAEERS